MEKSRVFMKVLPWFLIFGGFLSLIILPPIISGSCMVWGITILLERIWPEEWNNFKV